MRYKYSITKRIDENNGEVDVMKIGAKEPTLRDLINKQGILINKILITLNKHGEQIIKLERHMTKFDNRITKLEENK
ncbi:MAG: hypothetical protein LBJ97_03235 [Mycoplasmataceae bacterium]|jgi:hypothetical protein|nr:hypothetical protein [Mycoplasmataceae bacterium]